MKGKYKSFFLGKKFRKASEGLLFFSRVLFGVFCCFAGIFMTFSLAKNGSDILYYALAFASPANAADYFSESPSANLEISLPEKADEPFSEPEEEIFTAEDFLPAPEIFFEVPEENRGKVTEIQYSTDSGKNCVPFGNALIKNCTRHSAEKILSVLKTPHKLSLSAETEKPQVLIYHTHATEAFEKNDLGYFDTAGSWRSTDPDENMISVGNRIVSVLSEKGIGVIHDCTMHDDPSYSGSYQRSAVTIKKHLEENQGITVCLDIHRDAIEPSASEIMKPTAVINGKKAAQIMIISGCDDGTMDMPDYWNNLRFAAALADKMEELYPGLCRPILFDYRKYNMDLSPGLLLIEIGATGNTHEEAKYSAELFANALYELLCE